MAVCHLSPGVTPSIRPSVTAVGHRLTARRQDGKVGISGSARRQVGQGHET